MANEATARNILEHMLLDASVTPKDLPISLLESITNNFSDDQKIGSGGFAIVYKGMLQNGTVAVKKLSQKLEVVHEAKFIQEVDSLMRVKHENIVRFMGYCSDTQGKMCKHEGKNVMAEDQQRLLCFEFLPNGGLDKYISDASGGFDWRTRYQIIMGICKGLRYLHQQNIVHLDLKPANILVDHYMVPKITDFGLSKCFDEKQTRAVTSNICGSWGYMAPEFHNDGEITFKSDIYSLGIIITEMLTGRKVYPKIENVLDNWRARFESSQGDTWLEYVRLCAEIGIKCINYNPVERPDIHSIIEMLEEMDGRYGFIETDPCTSPATDASSSSSVSKLALAGKLQWMGVPAAPSPPQRIICVAGGPGERSTAIRFSGPSETSKLLDVYPQELRFPFERNKHIECPVTFTNMMDHFVGIWIIPTDRDMYSDLRFTVLSKRLEGPIFQMMEPHSSLGVVVTVKKKRQPRYKTAKLEVLMVIMDSKECLQELESAIGSKVNMDIDFLKRIDELGGELHQTVLTAVICDPTSHLVHSCTPHRDMLGLGATYGDVMCIDVHPTEAWILVGHRGMYATIWNYETLETVMVRSLHVRGDYNRASYNVQSAKFIPLEQWFAMVGDGKVHVYCAYPTTAMDMLVKEFVPHHHNTVTCLAVHPTEQLLLTSTVWDNSIKIWDWGQGWICTREITGHTYGGVTHLSFNPMDTNTFSTTHNTRFNNEDEVKIWNIGLPDPIAILGQGQCISACHFFTHSHVHFLLTHAAQSTSHSSAMIWDLERRVHQLTVKGEFVFDAACHPTLPILATATLLDSANDSICHIYLWDAMTYRLEKMVQLTNVSLGGMVFTGSKDLVRLVVPCEDGVSIIEINFPMLKTDGGN